MVSHAMMLGENLNSKNAPRAKKVREPLVQIDQYVVKK